MLDIERLTHTIAELEESILSTGDVANAVRFYQNQAAKLNVSDMSSNVLPLSQKKLNPS